MPGDSRPRLLLDTNVLVDLAQGKLSEYKSRLRAIASVLDAPLIWVPEVVVLELVAPLFDASAGRFAELVSALRWADELAGNRLAEGYDYALRMGTATRPLDFNEQSRVAINQARRALILMRDRGDLRADLVEVINFMREVRDRQRTEWVKRFTDVALPKSLSRDAAKRLDPEAELLEGQEIVDRIVKIAGESLVAVADRHSGDHGPARSIEDAKFNLREFLYFDAAVMVKGMAPNGYNHEGHKTDFHDWVLCSYPALGYTVVTRDKRLLEALEMTKCPSPRVVSLEFGLKMAEEWLANRALNPTGLQPSG